MCKFIDSLELDADLMSNDVFVWRQNKSKFGPRYIKVKSKERIKVDSEGEAFMVSMKKNMDILLNNA